jgi:hypothetical protein
MWFIASLARSGFCVVNGAVRLFLLAVGFRTVSSLPVPLPPKMLYISWGDCSRSAERGKHYSLGRTPLEIVFSKRRESWVRPVPEALDPVKTGPLLCGGVTVFAPFLIHNVPSSTIRSKMAR